MTLESGITFFLAIFLFGITPGPGIFAILARSMVQGAKACFWLSTGMVISDIVYLLMACFGLAAVANTWEELFLVIRFLGAAYLIFLGWKMWTTKAEVGGNISADQQKGSGASASFLQGFLISASNPKVILFYIAFLPTFMDVTVLKTEGVALAAILTFIALLSGLTLVAFGAAQARRYLKSEKAMTGLNRTAGSIMVSAGAYIGIHG